MLSKAFRAIGVILLTASMSSIARAESESTTQEQNVAWTPAKDAAKPTEELDNKTYTQRKAQLLKTLDRASSTDAGLPALGVLVTAVYPHQPGAKLGIEVGNVITKLNDEQATPSAYRELVDSGQPFTLTLWSPAHGEETFTAPGGLLEIEFEPFIRLDRFYWQNSKHNEKWDDDVLLAATARNGTAFAMTALARARKAGCDDPLLQAIAAHEAYLGLRYEAALDSIWAELDHLDPALQPFFVGELWNAAMLSANYSVADQLMTTYPTAFAADADRDEMLKDLHNHLNKIGPADRTLRETVAMEKDRPSVDFTDRLEHMPFVAKRPDDFGSATYGYMKEGVTEWKRDHHIKFQVQPNHYEQCDFGPPGQNVSFAASFTGQMLPNHKPGWAEDSMALGLLAYDAKRKIGRILVRELVTATGEVRVETEYMSLPTPLHVDMARKHEARIVLIGPWAQVLMDDRVVCSTMIFDNSKDRQMLGTLCGIGVDAVVHTLEWKHYEEANATTQPAK